MFKVPARPCEPARVRPFWGRWVAAALGAMLVGCSGADEDTEAVALPAVHASALGNNPCTEWVLPVLRSRDAPDELRVDLTYVGNSPKGQDFAHYAVVVTDAEPDSPMTTGTLIRGQPPHRPLEPVRLDSRKRPVYAISGWYRRERPSVLYLIRLPMSHPDLAALGLEVWPDQPFRSGSSYLVAKHSGLVPQKVLLLEPATIEGLDAKAQVCRAKSPRG